MPPMNLLVLQHADVEHPGVFRDFFREDGFRTHTVELDQGETIPALDAFEATSSGPLRLGVRNDGPRDGDCRSR